MDSVVSRGKSRNMRRWVSEPLTEEEQDRLSRLTCRRLFLGPLPLRDSAEREHLRLRKIRTI